MAAQRTVVVPKGKSEPVFAHPTLAGYVAARAEVDGSFSTSLLIMTWPDGHGGLHVSVNRASGRAIYFGTGKLEHGAVHFSLDAVRGPSAAETTVTGKLSAGHLADLHIVAGRAPQRVRMVPVEDR